jgi:hypothetical protein
VSRFPSYATRSAGEPVRTFRARNVEVRLAPTVVLCLLGILCVVPDGGVQDPVAKDRRACRTRAYRDDLRIVQVLISWAGELQRSGPRVAVTHINAERLAVADRSPFTEWSVLLARGVRGSWSRGANVLAAGVWSMQHPEGAAEITGKKRKGHLLGSSKRLDANGTSWTRQTSPRNPTCAEMTAYTDELTIHSIQLSVESRKVVPPAL